MPANDDIARPKLSVLLMQLPVPNNPALNVPLALGYLKAYAYAQGLLDQVEIELLPRALVDHAGDALLVNEIVARKPDVLGVALYTWNSERSLEIVDRVKAQLPELTVVVGGPEVQRDNLWVLEHPAVDISVLGEGEQTFADLLRFWIAKRALASAQQHVYNNDGFIPLALQSSLQTIPGLAFRDAGTLCFTSPRVALSDLAAVPSPYLLGYLEVPADGMMMVEVSRWCPYACSFCLYGRNMGTKLGNRYFGLERVVDEISWARRQGVAKVHFVEANLNLVPLFWPLMRLLEEINADHQMTFYAELRGEHLTDEVVAALHRANVRFVEVGLQTANPAALRASHRRTDLNKWAAGTRRLYDHNIEVYLDVILGLPEDNAVGVQQTLEFIEQQALGPYDVFTLQMLPGTAVREQAQQYGLRYQERPPYYVFQTNQFSYGELRRLRRELKADAGLDPDTIEGLPQSHQTALQRPIGDVEGHWPVRQLWLALDHTFDPAVFAERFASHVDLVIRAWEIEAFAPMLETWICANPATVFDLYILCDTNPPTPAMLNKFRSALPYKPGYLDRVAAYSEQANDVEHRRVSPRMFVVLPWNATVEPDVYRGIADVIWQFELEVMDAVPFGAWRAAGGVGIALELPQHLPEQERASVLKQVWVWQQETGRLVWLLDDVDRHDAHISDENLSVYSGRI